MIRIGLIHNPRSQRNRSAAAGDRRSLADELGIGFAAPASPAELLEDLSAFARREVALIVVDGGDGTLREVLTALPLAYGTALPAVAVLASGKTNVVAARLGSGGHGAVGLRRLAELVRRHDLKGMIRRHRALTVCWCDGSHAPMNGFFLGAAAFTRAVGLAQGTVHRRGVTQKPAVALTIGWSLCQALVGQSRTWLAGEPLGVCRDGVDQAPGNRLIFLATTLDRLMLGLWPFWGDGQGAIRFLDVAADPARLAIAFWRVLRGRPAAWMARDYRSGTAGEIVLTLRHPFILDGEAYEAGAGGIRICAGPEFGFVVP